MSFCIYFIFLTTPALSAVEQKFDIDENPEFILETERHSGNGIYNNNVNIPVIPISGFITDQKQNNHLISL